MQRATAKRDATPVPVPCTGVRARGGKGEATAAGALGFEAELPKMAANSSPYSVCFCDDVLPSRSSPASCARTIITYPANTKCQHHARVQPLPYKSTHVHPRMHPPTALAKKKNKSGVEMVTVPRLNKSGVEMVTVPRLTRRCEEVRPVIVHQAGSVHQTMRNQHLR